MKVRQAIELARGLKQIDQVNYPDILMLQFLNECEGKLQTEFLHIADVDCQRYTEDDMDMDLIVGPPHDKLYYAYLCAMVDFTNGEYAKYNNSIIVANAFMAEWAAWFNRTHERDGRQYLGVFLSAYGIAVKHGYEGTEEEWLESLRGPEGQQGIQGKPGPQGAPGTVSFEELTPEQVAMLKGEKGDKGEQGEQGIPGVAGSDAAVTAKNIQSALGYTPADSNDVSTKLDKPTTAPEVGKILKVTAVNEDGSFVCEWADAPSGGGAVDDVQVNGTSVVADGVANIPLAKMGSTGVVKFDAFMPFTFNADALRLANADENELTNPRYGFSTNRAITASNYRLAVELAMCDGKGAAWTDAEKTGAWKRLNSIKTTMDSVATPHTQYYLGNQTAVDIVLPDSSDVGQIIMVCWYNGATAATLSITGTMLAFDYTPSANTRSEINALWDGTYWAVLGNEMEVPSDAETT